MVEGRELLGGRQAHLVTDRPVAGDSQAGRGGDPWVDGGELLGGGQADLVTDRSVAGDVPMTNGQGVIRAESSPETSKARTGREKPGNDRSPTSRLTTRSSAAAFTRWVTRICQGDASAQRRVARLVTLPTEAYSMRSA